MDILRYAGSERMNDSINESKENKESEEGRARTKGGRYELLRSQGTRLPSLLKYDSNFINNVHQVEIKVRVRVKTKD